MKSMFPFDLFGADWFASMDCEIAKKIAQIERLSLKPPWPWGQWTYGHLLTTLLPKLPGDLIEFGVAKGGMSLFLGDIANACGRRVFALDSFEGLPAPSAQHDNQYFVRGDYASRTDRESLYLRFLEAIDQHKLGHVIQPCKGYFTDTFSRLRDQTFAFAHIDADLYDSVLYSLEALWPQLCEGAIVAVDDYFHHSQGPARAVSTFFRRAGIDPVLHVVFPYSVLFTKGEQPPPNTRSLDGRIYSFALLRADRVFREVVHRSRARAEAAGSVRAAANAAILATILDTSYRDRSSTVFDYCRSLEDYWDDMKPLDVEDRNRVLI